MTARSSRVKRLLAATEGLLAAKERELAAARATLEQREATLAAAARAVEVAGQRWLEVDSTEDLALASARRRSLARRAELDRAAVDEAAREVRGREVAAVEARKDERRLEIVVEGIEAAEAARRSKAERKLADEHAARMGRRS